MNAKTFFYEKKKRENYSVLEKLISVRLLRKENGRRLHSGQNGFSDAAPMTSYIITTYGQGRGGSKI